HRQRDVDAGDHGKRRPAAEYLRFNHDVANVDVRCVAQTAWILASETVAAGLRRRQHITDVGDILVAADAAAESVGVELNGRIGQPTVVKYGHSSLPVVVVTWPGAPRLPNLVQTGRLRQRCDGV